MVTDRSDTVLTQSDDHALGRVTRLLPIPAPSVIVVDLQRGPIARGPDRTSASRGRQTSSEPPPPARSGASDTASGGCSPGPRWHSLLPIRSSRPSPGAIPLRFQDPGPSGASGSSAEDSTQCCPAGGRVHPAETAPEEPRHLSSTRCPLKHGPHDALDPCPQGRILNLHRPLPCRGRMLTKAPKVTVRLSGYQSAPQMSSCWLPRSMRTSSQSA